MDYKGNVSRCRVFQSIFHWEKDCPDKNASEVTLYQSILHVEETLQFTGEAFCTATLDSEASKTVCSKTWLRCYEEILPKEKKEFIHSEPSTSIFKFGDWRKVQSIMKVTIPAKINNTDVSIVTDLVNDNITFLLSKEPIKKANTQINFSSDSVFMFNTKQPLMGHYAIPIVERASLEKLNEKKQRINLHAKIVDLSHKEKTAKKLHSQFSHPTLDKLTKLISNAGLAEDKDLIDNINQISKECQICRVYKRPFLKPVVATPSATEFNEVVAMDIEVFKNINILHLIDHVTRFSPAAIVKSKEKEEIIKNIFQIWISISGPPSGSITNPGLPYPFTTLNNSFTC